VTTTSGHRVKSGSHLFLTVRSDLDHRVLKILHSSEPSPLAAISPPPPQSSAAAAKPLSTPAPERRRTTPCPRPRFPRPRPRRAAALRSCARKLVVPPPQPNFYRFVEVTRWFPPQRDPRTSEGFYTPLHEDFYRAYVNRGIAFRPQRVCRLEALVEVVGEQLHPHLSFLPRLSDLLGRTGAYCGTWVREFYSSLWIDLALEFIHFAFRGRDRRLYSTRVREILRLSASDTKIHQLCFGQTAPLRHPHGGTVPPTDMI
jgi:hypothetical protein